MIYIIRRKAIGPMRRRQWHFLLTPNEKSLSPYPWAPTSYVTNRQIRLFNTILAARVELEYIKEYQAKLSPRADYEYDIARDCEIPS